MSPQSKPHNSERRSAVQAISDFVTGRTAVISLIVIVALPLVVFWVVSLFEML